MANLLVVVDMQNDFTEGALGTPEAAAILRPVTEKIRRAVSRGDAVVFTMDTHSPDYPATREGKYLPVPHCIEGTKGWQLHPDLAPFAKRIFRKAGFGSPELLEYIKDQGFDHVEFVGLCTDICVVTNALMLKGALPELDISVDRDCCAGVTPQSHEAALLTMKMCQIDI